MDMDALMFFNKTPQALPLYEAVAEKICGEFDDVRIKTTKSQISFSNKHNFAFVSYRKLKGHTGIYIILTFGLGYQVNHPRIEVSVEPYPNRWTHHVIIKNTDEVDEQIMEWLKEAYYFSLNK